MSDESIKSPGVSNNSLDPVLNYINAKLRVKFYGSSLKQGKITLSHKEVVNINIVYDTNLWQFSVSKDNALGNPLLGTILILIIINVLAMILDFMYMEVFRCLLVVGLVKT